MLKAPLLLPSAAPVHNTANVCPVIGTGVPGNRIAIWANKAVRSANPTISRESTRRPLLGIMADIRVLFATNDCGASTVLPP